MPNSLHTIATLTLALLLFTGCTTMQEVKQQNQPLATYLKVGDHIKIYEKQGRIIDMRYVRIDGTTLRGSLYSNGMEAVAVELDQIEKIEAERIEPGRTTAAVLGGIVVAPIIALGAGMSLAEQ